VNPGPFAFASPADVPAPEREVAELRAELTEARREADRMLMRATRLARVVTALGHADQTDVRHASEIAELFGCDVGVLLLGPDHRLRVAERWGVTLELLPDEPVTAPSEVARLAGSDAVLVGSVPPTPLMPPLAQLGVRHVVWIRLMVDNASLGFLVLGRRADRPFEDNDVDELRAAGHRLALSVDNAQLHRHTERQVVQLQRLLRLGTQLAGAVRPEAAARIIVEALREAAPGVDVGVYRRDGNRWLLLDGLGGAWPADHLPDRGPDVSAVPLRDGRREVGTILTRHMPDDTEAHQVLDHLADIAGLALSKLLLHERTSHQALHDALTGLPNRTLLRTRIDEALAADPAGVALVFCDLDRFKVVNDSLGHDAGDQLLVEIGRRLQSAVRAGDTVARLGGDEFVVLRPDTRTPDDALDLARRIEAAVAQPFLIGTRELSVSTSQGIVVATSESTANTLLRDADAAMYRAKARGRSRYELFDAGVRVELDARAATEQALRDALAAARLRAVYQPVVSLRSGRVAAVEALLRYEATDGSLVPAAEFIEVAEESDLIEDLGDWIIEEAIRQLAEWRERLGDAAPPRVLINLAARQLRRGLPGRTRTALLRHDVPAGAVAFELTETGLVSPGPEVLDCLAALRRLGVQVGIDDFGAGYSSLSHLKRFRLDFVKIDREFVAAMLTDDEDDSIVDAIVRFTSALGLRSIAEGVETAGQRDRLVELGCQLAQGHLFGRPVPPDELDAYLLAAPLTAAAAPATA
jgi:diguanylate cyclase (GGDEF)-like protein